MRPWEEEHVPAKSLQSCMTFCDLLDLARQAPLSMGILQARTVKWVAIPFSRGSSRHGNKTHVSCLQHLQASSLPLAPSGKT